MAATDSHRSHEEVARLAGEVYERRVRPTLRPDDDNKFYAIDVVTGDFEINDDDYTAVMRLRERNPEGELYLGRVGQPAACKMGMRRAW